MSEKTGNAESDVETFLEVEVKLAVDETTGIPDLTQLPGVDEILSTEEHNLTAIYYDTDDLRLTRAKITLRRRTGGDDDGWHLKLPAGSARTEMRAELGNPSEIPAELTDNVRAIVRNAQLSPIAQVDNRRVVISLGSPTGEKVAEFCDDHVTAWSLLPGGERSSWREWEVELGAFTAGTEAGAELIHQATSFLISSGARKSSSPSKLFTALGDSLHSAPLPPHMTETGLDPQSPEGAVVEALRGQRDSIVSWDPRVRADEWDSVHQMRVSTREMRSLLETFEGILEGEQLGHLETELKDTAATLGVARDAEVVEERFIELLDSDESGLIDDAAAEHIRDDMRADYEAAHEEIVGMLNSERFLTLLDDIDALLANPPVSSEIAAEIEGDKGKDSGRNDKSTKGASKAILYDHLAEGFKKVTKRDAKVQKYYHDTDLPLHDREEYVHDVRKAAKKLRYAAVAAQGAGVKSERLAKACKALQSLLGDFQDAVTSRDRIQRLAEEARGRGEDTFAYGMLYQRELARGEEALEGYEAAIREVKKAFSKIKV
ncbi:CYTH and CHAD domain-containing protein [Corynebacterium sanguinis]|uniref:CYTH and CHAD domain-containing protein n=1 Tax=Corynebacterium sanguinis TaxID=2594913 RepID=A0A6C1U0Z5_9CORY|nr:MULTISPECIES: CYTH and CHAD domain-containing protein [Corynebacterium]MCT1554907.1 CYTH and CHAD domain-containing protein [Corynebacterium sanguinis]MCT1583681.1 CYTH and CHAD domain-containing protein [Corynebacterium sanguinis]MCT1613130.1 CYTH and CHAD domain-containing protein [Corynebacterium sanguinis]MCT1627933.1 CYTH and CHAD domain-containing protein [Corynebacterium sanguinis]MCT1662988.1 CYTH and CHAD domain-containing protein [Corynebacterium sanguinis]